MNSKKGFTLIEILAVLVILAVIALIAVPSVFRTIENSRKKAIENHTKILSKTAMDYHVDQVITNGNLDKVSLTDDSLSYKGQRPEVGYAYFDEKGRTYLKMYYDGYCVVRDYDGKIEYEKTSLNNCPIGDMASVTVYPNGGEIVVSDEWSVGEGYASIIIASGSYLDPAPVVTKIGHTFKGWYDEENLFINITKPITDNLTVTAKWEANKYLVTLDLAGGILEGTYTKTREIEYGKVYGSLPRPTREGYDFLGWYTTSGIEVTSETLLTNPNNHTLIAQWRINTYTVTFEGNGGSTPEPITVTYGNVYGKLPIPTRDGYTFNGWITTGGIVITEDSIVEIMGDITLYAQWSINSYLVTFDATGGTISTPTTLIVYGNTYGSTLGELPVPTREGYEFAGWYTATIDGTVVTKDTPMNIANNHSVYAHWTANTYTLTFDSTGGSEVDSIEVIYGSSYPTLPTPTKEGNTFLGWYSTDGTKFVPNVTVDILDDITLYAQWDSNAQDFAYTGNYQKYVVPKSGNYKIELWGAGGSKNKIDTQYDVQSSGFGAYTAGTIYLEKDTILYIYAGEKGRPSTFDNATRTTSYNGGGANGIVSGSYRGTSGSGATDIRYFSTTYDDSSSELLWNSDIGLKSRIMVAAGGTAKNQGGGGLKGYTGSDSTYNGNYSYGGKGGTQTAAGAGGAATRGNYGYPGSAGQFGIGGTGGDGDWQRRYNYGGPGGSGGYYGGGGSGGGGYWSGHAGGGGSGSSFISGHTGCVAISSSTSLTPKSGCTDGTTDNACSIHYSGYSFTNTKMIDGMGKVWTTVVGGQEQMPNPNGGYYDLGKGHEGDGYARITFLSE